jgi:hypothetical protein
MDPWIVAALRKVDPALVVVEIMKLISVRAADEDDSLASVQAIAFNVLEDPELDERVDDLEVT